MKLYRIWLQLRDVWRSAPSCGGDCHQGDKACNCRRTELSA
jgi:hypothetical protein